MSTAEEPTTASADDNAAAMDAAQTPPVATTPVAPVDSADPGATPSSASVAQTEPVGESASIRRAPKYSVFKLFGVAVGLLVAAILTFAFPTNSVYETGQVFGYLAVLCAVIGLALGSLLAWLLDLRSRRRAGRAEVERRAERDLR